MWSWSRPPQSAVAAEEKDAEVLDVHDFVVLDVVLGSMRMLMAPRRREGDDFCWVLLVVPTKTRHSVDRIQSSIDFFVCGADAVVLVMAAAVVAARTAGPLLSPNGCGLSWS
jgi:hypothetical protein